jgi:hypothetical protein
MTDTDISLVVCTSQLRIEMTARRYEIFSTTVATGHSADYANKTNELTNTNDKNNIKSHGHGHPALMVILAGTWFDLCTGTGH